MLQVASAFRHQLCAPVLRGARSVAAVAANSSPATGSPVPLASVTSTQEKSQVKQRRVVLRRDPEAPKRPISPFFRYLADFRGKTENVSGKETVKQAAVQWKALTSLQKTPFQVPYEKERTAYVKAKAEYVSSGKKDAWKRDPEKPKKPLTSYLRFVQDHRKTASTAGMKVTEVVKSAAAAWKILPLERKKIYESDYVKEKAKYEEDVRAYKASGNEKLWKDRVGFDDMQKSRAKAKAKASAKAKAKAKARAKAKAKAKTKPSVAADASAQPTANSGTQKESAAVAGKPRDASN